MKEEHTFIPANREVGPAIIVIVAGGAASPVQVRIDTNLLGYIFKLAVAEIVVKGHSTLRSVVGQENVDLSIVVIVEEAGSRAQHPSWPTRISGARSGHNSRFLRHIHKPHLDLRQRL